MNKAAMMVVAEGLVALIRRHTAEQREQVESRVKAGETVMAEQRERIDVLEARLAEVEASTRIRRIA